MNNRRVGIAAAIVLLGVVVSSVWFLGSREHSQETAATVFSPKVVAAKAAKLKESADVATLDQLVDTYKELGVIDAHNHDASDLRYQPMLEIWKQEGVEKVVLFGDVSERSAIETDKNAWKAYQDSPDQFIPYFSGFDLHDPRCLEIIKQNLEKGYFGLGEIAAASTYSPIVSKVEWKANDPMDGYLPQIYDLIASYKAPILLHIDPMSGEPIAKLEQALNEHPNTIFILGHINAYNSPGETDRLLSKHPNLYADFFAGFSVYNPDGGERPEQFIPVMKKYADRFMISTDSGYEMGEVKAIDAMYRILHLLDDPKIARQIALDNLMRIIQAEQATETQLKEIRKLGPLKEKHDLKKLSKLEAGKILAGAGEG